MSVVHSETIPVVSEADMVAVRRRVREVAAKVGLSLVDQTKLVTAASELARNTLIYGGGGSMELESLNGPRLGIRLNSLTTGRALRTSNWRYAMDLRRIGLGPWIGRI